MPVFDGSHELPRNFATVRHWQRRIAGLGQDSIDRECGKGVEEKG